MKLKYLQQGDVILKVIKKIPNGDRIQTELSKNRILAEGEATGHAHRIEDQEGVEVFSVMNQLYAIIAKETVLRHEEHHPIKLPSGLYEVGIVREYDHFAEEARKVAD